MVKGFFSFAGAEHLEWGAKLMRLDLRISPLFVHRGRNGAWPTCFIDVWGILYHQYVDPMLKGARLMLKPSISRIIHRVTLLIELRGSLADDRTARMLHVLLAALAVW